MKTRRRFSAEFKAKVALEAIRGERTLSELATKHQLHPNQITQWKRQAIENLAKAFDDKAADAQAGRDAEVTKLHAKIGQLVVERLARVAEAVVGAVDARVGVAAAADADDVAPEGVEGAGVAAAVAESVDVAAARAAAAGALAAEARSAHPPRAVGEAPLLGDRRHVPLGEAERAVVTVVAGHRVAERVDLPRDGVVLDAAWLGEAVAGAPTAGKIAAPICAPKTLPTPPYPHPVLSSS